MIMAARSSTGGNKGVPFELNGSVSDNLQMTPGATRYSALTIYTFCGAPRRFPISLNDNF